MLQFHAMNIPSSQQPRVVVIGGGFAGIAFIKKMIKAPVQLVLFDKHNYHTFQPLLYQVSTAGLEPDSIAYPLRKIFRKHDNFHFRLAEVTHVNPDERTIETSIGNLKYDYLVLATGTRTNFFGNKNVEQFSMPMKSVPQALNIRSLMLQNIEKADQADEVEVQRSYLNFVIAGGGPTGVELAGALAEFRKGILKNDYPELSEDEMQIHIVEGSERLLASMSEEASQKAQKFLEGMGVQIHLQTLVSDYDGVRVATKDGKEFKTATFIWAAGVTGAPIEGFDAKVVLERTNRYQVNKYNQLEGYENVFALGDIAAMQTEAFPKGHPQMAQPAIQQGKHLAKNLQRVLKGHTMKPFKYLDKGSMATIGRNKAVVDFKKMHFGGFFAWFLWMFVHLWYLVGFRNRVITFFNWTYNYINYDRAARLIIREYHKKSS